MKWHGKGPVRQQMISTWLLMFNDSFPFDWFSYLFGSFLLSNSHVHLYFSFFFIHCFLNLLSFSTPYSNSLHSVFLLPPWVFPFHSFSRDICLIHCVFSHVGHSLFFVFLKLRVRPQGWSPRVQIWINTCSSLTISCASVSSSMKWEKQNLSHVFYEMRKWLNTWKAFKMQSGIGRPPKISAIMTRILPMMPHVSGPSSLAHWPSTTSHLSYLHINIFVFTPSRSLHPVFSALRPTLIP